MSAMRRIFGAFRLLRRRSTEVGQPGLGVWTDAGARAATEVQQVVSRKAHVAEVDCLEAEREIEAGLAGLRDGRVDAQDLAHFRRAGRLVRPAVAAAHDIGEAVS